MRRRSLLGGIAGSFAGAAVGVYALRARQSERALFLTAFRADRGRGLLMMMANVGTAENASAFDATETAILKGDDPDLALRLLLVHIQVTWNDDIVRSLTGDRPKLPPPWLAVIDGESPRLGEQMPLSTGGFHTDLQQFLRQAVSLDVAWLEQRAALAWRDNAELVRKIRWRIQDGSLTTDLARQAPAVVALEAMRRTGDARERLLAVLVPRRPRPLPKVYMVDCGMGAILMTPLGARFAAAFTKRRRPDGEREPKK